jgi:hypothetical protein
MNRIAEFYESNHLLVLTIIIFLFGIYILLMNKRNHYTLSSKSEIEDEEEKVNNKISTGSIFKVKYILTGEVITHQIIENKSSKPKNKSEIIRINFKDPLAVSIFDKEIGDIIKLHENEIYLEVLDVDNSFFSEEEREFFENNDLNINEAGKLSKNSMTIKKGTTFFKKDDLIDLLKGWLETSEETIGDIVNYPKNTEWIILYLNDKKYYINADTRKEAIKDFVRNHENNNSWKVIANRNNVYNKVTNDLNGIAIKYLYFYADKIGRREI